jgi:hypothetical protein
MIRQMSLVGGNKLKRIATLAAALLTPLFVTACNQGEPVTRVESTPEAAAPAASDAASAVATGTVTETMSSGGYTYIQVDTGSEEIWAAAPECPVKVGDQVAFPLEMPMRDYHSNTLDRDFELVYFVHSFQDPEGDLLTKGGGMPSGHPPMAGHPPAARNSASTDIDVSGVEKPEGGKTVGEIYANQADLSGKEVTLRGKVVKFNKQIMGKNWLHVRDGSGDADAGTNDLTVTTDATARIGDTVLVTGQVHLDKDFGYGYKYDVIIEDAQVEVE